MNERGLTIMGFVLFWVFLLAVGVYFSGGIYTSLINLNIGDPIFFQLLGVGMLLLAGLAIAR